MMRQKSPLKSLGIRKQKEIIRLVTSAMQDASLATASFSHIGTSGPFPTKESEVDAFIKERARLHHDSWVIAPLRQCLKIIQEARDD